MNKLGRKLSPVVHLLAQSRAVYVFAVLVIFAKIGGCHEGGIKGVIDWELPVNASA